MIYARTNALAAVAHTTAGCHYLVYVHTNNFVNQQVTGAAGNFFGGEYSS
jgi:hypothetical protein